MRLNTVHHTGIGTHAMAALSGWIALVMLSGLGWLAIDVSIVLSSVGIGSLQCDLLLRRQTSLPHGGYGNFS
jgi:hypothetical protein